MSQTLNSKIAVIGIDIGTEAVQRPTMKIVATKTAEQLEGVSRRSLLGHLSGQWFALFDHKSRNGLHGRRSLVDAFVDFVGLNVE